MALYQSGNVTGVIDRHGRPKMVTLPGRAPEVDTSAPVIGLPRGLPKTMITGRWISRNSKSKPTWFERELAAVDGANVFGQGSWGSTFLQLEDSVVNIPLVSGLDFAHAIAEYNGARLVPFGKALPISAMFKPAQKEIAIMSFTYSSKYVSQYVRSGAGFFLETHPFPHYAFAASPTTRATVILGKPHYELRNTYVLTAFDLPYGHVMFIPENTMHNDGFTVGEIAISVDPTDTRADSAFLRDARGNKVDIQLKPPSECVLNAPSGAPVFINRGSTHPVCKTPASELVYRTPHTFRNTPMSCMQYFEDAPKCPPKDQKKRKTSGKKKRKASVKTEPQENDYTLPVPRRKSARLLARKLV